MSSDQSRNPLEISLGFALPLATQFDDKEKSFFVMDCDGETIFDSRSDSNDARLVCEAIVSAIWYAQSILGGLSHLAKSEKILADCQRLVGPALNKSITDEIRKSSLEKLAKVFDGRPIIHVPTHTAGG